MKPLRRYTSAMALIDLIRHQRLTLLSPAHWYDQNDVLGLQAYSDRRGERGSVYAACFAMGYEQAHHWQLFAGNEYGLCLVFDRDRFARHLDQLRPMVLHKPIEYVNLRELTELGHIDLEQIPFLKRDTFEAEAEYRVVAWEDEFFATPTYTIPCPITLLERVVFGPAMHDTYIETLQEMMKAETAFDDVFISRSRLTNNASWGRALGKALQTQEHP